MVQSHDNDWFYILLCDFQLRTKKFYYHIHIAHFITRDFAHYELTQDKINCRIIDSITISKSLQLCLHLRYRIDITLQDLLLQRLRHFLDILDWGCYEWHNLYALEYFISSTTHSIRLSMLGREDCETIRCKYLSSY